MTGCNAALALGLLTKRIAGIIERVGIPAHSFTIPNTPLIYKNKIWRLADLLQKRATPRTKKGARGPFFQPSARLS